MLTTRYVSKGNFPPSEEHGEIKSLNITIARGEENRSTSLSLIWWNTGALLLLLTVITVIGGIIFVLLESPHEENTMYNVEVMRRQFLSQIREVLKNVSLDLLLHSDSYNRINQPVIGAVGNQSSNASASSSPADVAAALEVQTLHQSLADETVSIGMQRLQPLLGEYETQLESALVSGYFVSSNKASSNPPLQWDLWGAMYYCFSLYTTIGYGNLYPRTFLGQLVSVVYALFSIPLCLLVIGRLGQLFNRIIKTFWRRCVLRNANFSTLYCDADDRFDYPLPLAILLVSVYVFAGAVMYSLWERWSITKAAYFTFVSLSTIGFGDVLPDDHRFFLITSMYVFFGLALLAMLVNALVERLEYYLLLAKKDR